MVLYWYSKEDYIMDPIAVTVLQTIVIVFIYLSIGFGTRRLLEIIKTNLAIFPLTPLIWPLILMAYAYCLMDD